MHNNLILYIIQWQEAGGALRHPPSLGELPYPVITLPCDILYCLATNYPLTEI